jgi:hypothetical protein
VTTKKNLSLVLRNIARGAQKNYWEVRDSVFSAFRDFPRDLASPLPAYLAKTLLALPEKGWSVISVTEKDLDSIQFLSSQATAAHESNYWNLVIQYITENEEAVQSLERRQMALSKALLSSDFDGIVNAASGFKKAEKQSLLYLRTFAAARGPLPRLTVEELGTVEFSNFVRNGLLHPLTFYALNMPTEEGLDQHLSFAVPDRSRGAIERILIRFFLCSELDVEMPPSIQGYLALLTHPYDAYEILLHYLEGTYVRTATLSKQQVLWLRTLVRVSPSFRAKSLLEHVDNSLHPPYAAAPTDIAWLNVIDAPEDWKDYFVRSTRTTDAFSDFDLGTSLSKCFGNSRAKRYPDEYEYSNLLVYFKRYWFLDIGRFLFALTLSMYLLPRSTEQRERLSMFRLGGFIGLRCPYIYASPMGMSLLEQQDDRGRVLGEPEIGLPKLIRDFGATKDAPDRMWLKRVHLELYLPQKQSRITEWTKGVRSLIPVAPEYLTGIKWDWLNAMIKVTRIAPFRGDPASIFVFLLQLVETRTNDALLRISIEPIALAKGSLQPFSEWLFNEYGSQSIAFFQYYLTPPTILRLRFTNNYLEALSDRIRCFQAYVERFGFNDLLTEKQFRQEATLFETELMLLNVGTNQFEIVWSILRTEALIALADLHKSVAAFERREGDVTDALSEAKTILEHIYPTGRHLKYNVRFKDQPAATFVITAIEGFMQHPSQGIESILSIRIRHINFRRQFEEAIEGLRRETPAAQFVPKINGVDVLSRAVFEAVQDWLDTYLHQTRPDKPKGAFDFVPSENDLRMLAEHVRKQQLESAVDTVYEWIRQQLEQSLRTVRDLLTNGLRSAVKTALLAAEVKTMKDTPEHKVSISTFSGIIQSSVNELITSLADWFRSNSHTPVPLTTPRQMEMVVRGRYQSSLERRILKLRFIARGAEGFTIRQDALRMVFDLACEAINNAITHGSKPMVRMTILPYSKDGISGLRFISTVDKPTGGEEYVEGNPTDPQGTMLFREGKSGRDKMAVLSASISRAKVSIHIMRRKRYFIVSTPFEVSMTRKLL